MGRLGMSRNKANRIARKRASKYAIERTEVAIIAVDMAFSAMSSAMANIVRALYEVR
jgi:hypothetical protein